MSAMVSPVSLNPLIVRIARYTRLVRIGKWALAALALALLMALLGLPLVSRDRSGIRISFMDSTASGTQPANSPVMENPEFRSGDLQGKRYRVNGVKALQLSSDHLVLEQVEAQLADAEGNWRSLTAAQAEYFQQEKRLELKGDVTLVDARGYEFITPQATVNTETLAVTGTQPVTGSGALGHLRASRFEIRENGQCMTFFAGEHAPVTLRIERQPKAGESR